MNLNRLTALNSPHNSHGGIRLVLRYGGIQSLSDQQLGPHDSKNNRLSNNKSNESLLSSVIESNSHQDYRHKVENPLLDVLNMPINVEMVGRLDENSEWRSSNDIKESDNQRLNNQANVDSLPRFKRSNIFYASMYSTPDVDYKMISETIANQTGKHASKGDVWTNFEAFGAFISHGVGLSVKESSFTSNYSTVSLTSLIENDLLHRFALLLMNLSSLLFNGF